jgi:hypothetical protein
MDHTANLNCVTHCFAAFNSDFSEISHAASTAYNASIQTGRSQAFNGTEAFVYQPRVGFSYAPQGNSGRIAIRGGIGMFSDAVPGLMSDYFITNAPNVLTYNYTQSGAGSTLVDATQSSGNAYSYLGATASAFHSGFAAGQTMAQIAAAATALNGMFVAPTMTAATDSLKTPKYLEWNLETQIQVSRSDVLDFNYVGNYAWDTFMLNNLANAYSPTGVGGLAATATDTRFGMVTDLSNNGSANYNGLTASFRHTAKYGLTLSGNYTYSHALDRVSNGGLEGFNLVASSYTDYPQSQVAPDSASRLNYGNADYDIRHSMSLQYVWKIPATSHVSFLKPAVEGWNVSGNVYYRGGYPMSITNSGINHVLDNQLTTAASRDMLATMTAGKDFACTSRPTAADVKAGNQSCFSSDTFAQVNNNNNAYSYAYGFGNYARNSFRGPHYFNSDMQLNKETKILEKATLKIGADFYNVLNHANFAAPVTNANSSQFGVFYSTAVPPSSPYGSFMGSAVSGRVVQLLTSISF